MTCNGKGTLRFSFGGVAAGHQLAGLQVYASCREPTTCSPASFPHTVASVTTVVDVPAAAGGWGSDCKCAGGVTPYFMVHAAHSSSC